MAKIYLKKGDKVFTTGAWLLWDGEKLVLDEIDEDTFFDGQLVNTDENGKYYICP